ncbi:hypothetical protein [Chitinophaga agri]|uniref:Uncharacterized protein n=1 Tax=Chitinophaga agri TaxID=2703787 RepID=A0A6B9ZH72_9BACT|nr:hypothetical protein [Chitinophaga agri]QHS60841.1 hypothetical protein GWR21_14920 [Chitinophaga agri]
MSLYSSQFPFLLQKGGIEVEVLPGDLQQLIERYEQAIIALGHADAETQQRLLFIVVQTDAVICATIYSLYKDRLILTDILSVSTESTDEVRLNKIKLLALRAKALQLKKNIN